MREGRFWRFAGGASIARRALMRMGLRVTAVVLLATGVSYWRAQTNLRADVLRDLVRYVDLRAKTESDKFLLAERQTAIVRDEFMRRYAAMGEVDPVAEFDHIFVRDPDGLIRVRGEINDHVHRATAYLRHDVALTPDLRRRFLIGWELLDQWGPVLVNRFFSAFMNMPEQLSINFCPAADWARSATRTTDQYQYETVWHSTPAKNPERRPFWTTVYYDEGAKEWMVSCVTVGDKEGRWIVSAGQDVLISDLIARTASGYVPGAWSFIVDSQGNLIAHPKMTAQIAKMGGNLKVAGLGDAELLSMVNTALAASSDVAKVEEPGGLDVLLGIGRIRGPGWSLVTVYPRRLLKEQASINARFVLGTGLASLLLELVLMALILRRQIAEPVAQLVSATERISLGDFSVRLDPDAQDELGRLATSVNRMAQAVGERDAALGEQAALLRIAGHTARLGGWSIALPERTLVWSEEVFRIHELEPGPVPQAAEALNYYAPEWRTKVQQSFEACVIEGRPFDIEAELTTAKGHRIWVRVIGTAERDARGGITRLQGAIQDITERKQTENERTQLEAKLRQAQKMEAVGQLAGGVAHDFNNMLGVILGYTDLALEGAEAASPIRGDLEEVKSAAKRSAALTGQLLAFARKQAITPQVVDLNATVSSMLSMLGRLVREDIELKWHPALKLAPVHVDPTQIDQILANLVVNARDAGAHTITICTEMAEFDGAHSEEHPNLLPGRYVSLSVKDDGSGMDASVREHIFEPFFTTKKVGEGTGLGLATVYGIAHQNGGDVEVESELGRGTTFKVFLPAHQSANAPLHEGRLGELPGGSETVLLVEDEPALRRLCGRLLQQLGYTVLVAETPQEAVRLAEEHAGQIHLLMTDVVMPEMNGRELKRSLDAIVPGMKCLFVSGYTADIIADQGVLHEGVHLLAKPFALKVLAKKLREVLES